MARLADLQKKIYEATEEVHHLTQDDHDRRPQHRELRQEGSFNEDELCWGPSSSEGPQKHDLTMFPKCNI
jgi:hypothetical protein